MVTESEKRQKKYTLPECLRKWSSCMADDIDDILEWLEDEKFLNEAGLKFRHEFWEEYIHDKK